MSNTFATRRALSVTFGPIATLARLSLAVSAALLTAQAARATSGTWNGTTSTTWATTTNWSSGAAPGTGDTATFNNAGNNNVVISASGITIGNIVFDTSSAAAYTIGAGSAGSQTVTLNNGGAITVNSTVTNNELIAAKLVLGTDATSQIYTLTNNSATGTLTLSGGIQTGLTGGTAGLKTLNIGGSGVTAITGIISQTGTGVTLGLNLNGTGEVILTNNDSQAMTGGVTLTSGTLMLSNANALGGNTNLLTINGGTITNTITLPGAGNGAQTWNGNFGYNGSAALSLGGAITLGGDIVLTSTGSATLTETGVVTGAHNLTVDANSSGGITFSAAGSINNAGTFTNNGTGTGTVTINPGTNVTSITQTSNNSALAVANALVVGSGGVAFSTSGSAPMTVSTAISGSGPVTYTNSASGSLTISGGQTGTGKETFTDSSSGNIALTGALGGSENATFNSNGTGSITVGAISTTNTVTFNADTASNIVVSGAASGAGETIDNTGTGTGTTYLESGISAGVTLTENSSTSALMVTPLAAANIVPGTVNVLNGYMQLGGGVYGTSGATAANISSTGTLALDFYGSASSAGSFTGAINNNGVLKVAGSPYGGAYIVSGVISGSGNVIIDSTTGGAAANPNMNTTLSGLNTYTGATIINTGTLQLGSFSAQPTMSITAGSNTGTVSNAAGLAVGQTLLANSSFGSNVTITSITGTVVTFSSVASTTGSGVSAAFLDTANSLGLSDPNNAANLVINGGALQWTGNNMQDTDRLFEIGANGATIDYNRNSITTGLTFTNTGTLGFTGADYSDTLTLNAIGSTNIPYGAGVHSGNSNGNVAFYGTMAPSIQDNGSGQTSVTKTGGGTWVLAGNNNSFSGVTNVEAGALYFATPYSYGYGPIDVSSGAAVVLSYGGTNYITGGAEFGSGDVDYFINNSMGNFAAGSTLGIDPSDLNGTNSAVSGVGTLTYGSSVTLNDVNFARFNSTGNLSNVANLVLSGNITLGTGGIGVYSSSSTTGWTEFEGNNSYTGATTLAGGTLVIGSSTALGSTSALSIVTSSTIYLDSGRLSSYTINAPIQFNAFLPGSTSTLLLTIGSSTVAGSGNITFNDGLVGSNPVTGAGTVELASQFNTTGTTTFNGNIYISNGQGAGAETLLLDNYGAPTVYNMTNAVISDTAVPGVGTGNLSFGGLAGITMLGNANTYTGTTTISRGTVDITSFNSVSTSSTLGTVHSSSSSLGAPTTVATGTIWIGGAGNDMITDSGPGETTDRVIHLYGATGGGGIIDYEGTGTLTMIGGVTSDAATGNGYRTMTFQGNSSGSGVESGVIQDSSTGGWMTDVNKAGSDTWTLSGLNTYSGTTTITGGILQANTLANGGVASSIGESTSAGPNLILNGGTLQYVGGATSTNRSYQIGNNGNAGTGTFDASGTGALVITGSATYGIANQSRILGITGTSTAANTLSGTINDNGTTAGAVALTKNGVGTWVLSGANAYTGVTTINGGILSVSIVSNAGVSYSLTTTAGSGTVTLASTAGLYVGEAIYDNPNIPNGTTISSILGTGTIVLSSGAGVTAGSSTASIAGTANNLGLATNAPANLVINGGTLQYTGTAASTNRGFTIGTSGATLDASGSGAIDYTGTIAINTSSIARTLTLTGTSTGTNTLAGVLANAAGTTTNQTSVLKTGVGTWYLNGLNTFTGAVAVNSGVLGINTVAAVGTAQSLGEGTGPVDLGVANTSSGTLLYTGTGGTLGSAVTALGNGGDTIQNSGTGLLTLSGTLTKNNTVLTLSGGSSGIKVTGQITGGTSSNFNSDLNIVNGVTTLSASNNNYTGPTNIFNAGTLKLGVANAIPVGSVLNLGNATDGAVTNTFDLAGFNQTVASLNSTSNAGSTNVNTITNSATGTGTATLALSGVNSDSAASNGTFGGSITDGTTAKTALSVTGGVQTLTGNSNTYSGGTSVSGGTLVLGNTGGSATGSGALNVGAGAALAGTGYSSGSSFNITGNSGTAATVLVGHNSASDINTTGVMSLSASGASSIGAANLVFNLNSNVAHQGTELSVGATTITFNSVGSLHTTLTLNIEGTTFISSYTSYVLVAGTGTTAIGAGGVTSGQYSGLTTFLNSLGQEQIMTGPTSNLQLSFSSTTQAGFYAPSYLFLVNNDGVDDIEVEVVPEPGTWAMMLGGLAVLVFWQRRKNKIG